MTLEKLCDLFWKWAPLGVMIFFAFILVPSVLALSEDPFVFVLSLLVIAMWVGRIGEILDARSAAGESAKMRIAAEDAKISPEDYVAIRPK
jgi:hypothetical protein